MPAQAGIIASFRNIHYFEIKQDKWSLSLLLFRHRKQSGNEHVLGAIITDNKYWYYKHAFSDGVHTCKHHMLLDDREMHT